MKLLCWSCNKEHDVNIDFKAKSQLKLCECGGIIASRSGKVMAGVKEFFKDDLNEKSEKESIKKNKETRED